MADKQSKDGQQGGQQGGKPDGTPDGKDLENQQTPPNKDDEGGINDKTDQSKEKPQGKDKAPKEEEINLPPKEEDNSKLGQVQSLIEDAGLSMKDVAEIAKANDGALDLKTLVALQEKHGEAVATLIANQVKAIHTERVSQANARDQSIYDQVEKAFEGVTEQSGKETWAELGTWAKDNVSNEHRTEINKLLAQGGFAAQLAVQELVTAFKEASASQEYQEADLLEADNLPAGGGGDITKQDYTRELNKLLQAGHVYGQSSEIAKLDARRMKSMQRGV